MVKKIKRQVYLSAFFLCHFQSGALSGKAERSEANPEHSWEFVKQCEARLITSIREDSWNKAKLQLPIAEIDHQDKPNKGNQDPVFFYKF